MAKSTVRRTVGKPAKPYADFPLYPHASGRWAKRIRGQVHFFGRWAHSQNGKLIPVDDPEASAAEAKLELDRQWPYIASGRIAPPAGSAGFLTVAELCNAFLSHHSGRVRTGDLTPRAFADYMKTTDRLVATWGKSRAVSDLRPSDFAALRSNLARTRGATALGNAIIRVRSVMNFALAEGLIEKPVVYGQSFSMPSARRIQEARNAAGERMFEQHEVRTILDAVQGTPITVEGKGKPVQWPRENPMRAMVLLAINGGLGNTDIARLPRAAVDLEGGWLNYPRPKTAVPRRIPLWPETVDALKLAIAERPDPATRDFAGLMFLTWAGKPWVRSQPRQDDDGGTAREVAFDPLAQRFAKLLTALKMNGQRGRGFYALRHTFATQAGESLDQVAVNAIMGHKDTSMAARYRERISDERLRNVVNVVRKWLFEETAGNLPIAGHQPDV